MNDKTRAAMQQALEALVEADRYYDYDAIITALREALAEPDIDEMTLTQIAAKYEQAEQEPVLCVECGQPVMHIGNKCYACCQKATKELEDALKASAPVKQAEQEPVAKFLEDNLVVENERVGKSGHRVLEIREEELLRIMELYAAPVRTKDLTDDEIEEIGKSYFDEWSFGFARAVIAADREKNK